jgi:hypothetical protein
LLADCAACFAEGYDGGFAAGKRACIGRTEVPPHTVMVNRCLGDLKDLTLKERTFLTSLWRWQRLTPRQEQWLRAIYRRWEMRRRSAS